MTLNGFVASSAASAVTVACIAGSMASAQAAPPRVSDTIFFNGDDAVCSFNVEATFTSGQKEREVPNVVVSTGFFAITFTNVNSGKTVTYNASGPTLVQKKSGNVVLTGLSIVFQPEDHPAADTFLRYHSGRVVIDPATLTTVSSTGRVVDVCAALS